MSPNQIQNSVYGNTSSGFSGLAGQKTVSGVSVNYGVGNGFTNPAAAGLLGNKAQDPLIRAEAEKKLRDQRQLY